MKSTILKTWGAVALVSIVAFLVSACGDNGSSVTGATSVAAEATHLSTTGASHSRSGSIGNPAEEGGSDDDTGDDTGDAGEDHDSNAGSTDDDGSHDVDESEVRGLFFGPEACPAADCVLALRIKDTLVAVTNGTEIVNEAAGGASVSPSALAALLAGHLGLPMKAEGSSQGGVLVAQRLRIDDEIRATGKVLPGAPGCDFDLAVRLVELCFGLAPGVKPPASGQTVRVEGRVPSDFALPFLATRIEPSED